MQGVTTFMYTPAHKGGISANAYADAAAKAGLQLTPAEPELGVSSRLCVYSQLDEEQGRVPNRAPTLAYTNARKTHIQPEDGGWRGGRGHALRSGGP